MFCHLLLLYMPYLAMLNKGEEVLVVAHYYNRSLLSLMAEDAVKFCTGGFVEMRFGLVEQEKVGL